MSEVSSQQKTGMILANRAYAYSAFHLVFGAEPSNATVALVYDDRFLKILAQSGVHIEDVGSRRDTAGFVDSLKSDYTRLFEVPGPSYVYPWESPHTGKESMVFQASTLDVRKYYHAAGLKLQAEKRFPDDHIAAMMDFMGTDAHAAYEAYADGNDTEVAKMLRLQKDFAENHILNWIDLFSDKVAEKDVNRHYAAFAEALADYAKVDVEQVAGVLSELEVG